MVVSRSFCPNNFTVVDPKDVFFFFFACNFSNPSIFGECVWIFLYFLGWNPRQVLLRSRSEPPPNIHTCWQFFCWRNHGLELITLNDTESVYIYIYIFIYTYTQLVDSRNYKLLPWRWLLVKHYQNLKNLMLSIGLRSHPTCWLALFCFP